MSVRADTPMFDLSDEWSFRDTGCSIAPSCLNCPLDVCIEDDPLQFQREEKAKRDADIRRRRRAGEMVMVIAVSVGVSKRTVYRAVQRAEASA